MTKERMPAIVWVIVCAAAIIQALYYYPQLPERIATHFGASGHADGWSTKQDFITVYLGILAFVIALFTVLTYAVSTLPVSWINLPNKQYWFAAQQRQQTLAFLRRYPLWFASATVLLIIDMFHQTFLVNMGKAKSLPHPTLSLAVYIGFTAYWVIGLFLRFRKP
jgi:uncharacterized membrane protein